MLTVAGLFHSSFELEKAVLHLLDGTVETTQLRVIPLRPARTDTKPEGLLEWLMTGGFFGDTLHRSDGKSAMDGVAAGATLGGLAGVIAGAAVKVGPVILVVVGMLGGGLAGYVLDVLIRKHQYRRPDERRAQTSGTVLEVTCRDEQQAAAVEQILMHNQAHALGREL